MHACCLTVISSVLNAIHEDLVLIAYAQTFEPPVSAVLTSRGTNGPKGLNFALILQLQSSATIIFCICADSPEFSLLNNAVLPHLVCSISI